MMGKTIVQNYLDLGILIVKTHINGVEIPNTNYESIETS